MTNNSLTAAYLSFAAILILGCGDSRPPVAPTTGAIEISVSTIGANADVDPDGYVVTIDELPLRSVGVNERVTISALPTGHHFVRLDGLTPNCKVNGANPRMVNVMAGAVLSSITFAVSCNAANDDSGAGDWDY